MTCTSSRTKTGNGAGSTRAQVHCGWDSYLDELRRKVFTAGLNVVPN
jgi:hypothetical protein